MGFFFAIKLMYFLQLKTCASSYTGLQKSYNTLQDNRTHAMLALIRTQEGIPQKLQSHAVHAMHDDL